MRSASKLAAMALALSSAACISLLPSPPPAPVIYSLRAAETPAMKAPPTATLTIAVAAPGAPRSIAGADIVWRRNGVIGFMERASWDGAAPELLQSMLVEELGRRGGVRAAVRSGAGVRANTEVRWDIQSFEIVEDGALEARMQTTVTLVDPRTRTVSATNRFEARAPLSERSGRRAAAALQQVAQKVAGEIADWVAASAPTPGTPAS